MARRSTGVPEWFDLTNYDSLRDATLQDWLVELTNRKSCFSILKRARSNERIRDGRAFAFALDRWNRIRESGSLTGKQREVLKEVQARLADTPLFAQIMDSIESDQRNRSDEWLVKHGQSPNQGTVVSRLTKGDVLVRFLIAGEIDRLASEVNDTDAFPEGVLSPMPMDAIGTTQGENVGFVQVDLHAPDEMIKAEFDAWLSLQRQRQASSGEITPRMVSEADFADWCKYRVLPYIDLAFAMDYEGFRLTQERLGDLLFPDEPDVSIAERIRKVTRPKALAVFSDSFIRGLARQYEHSFADRNE